MKPVPGAKKIQPKGQEEDGQEKFLPVILFLLLLTAATFFVVSLLLPTPAEKPETISAYTPKAEALINKHLFLTSQNQHLQGKKINAENAYLAPQIGDSIWPKISPKIDLGVDHSPDRHENTAYDDLNRYRKELHYTNPDQVIQGQIADEDLEKKAEWEDRKEYARQFVENARRNGYSIKLNEDLVVVSVSPMGGAAH